MPLTTPSAYVRPTFTLDEIFYVRSLNVSDKGTTPTSISFKIDGTKMYVGGTSNNNVNEYDLSIPWNISSASFLQLKNIGAQSIAMSSIYFRADGLKFYSSNFANNRVVEYDLSVAWDISTATYLQLLSLIAIDSQLSSVHFKPDGTKMYWTGVTTRTVYEYDLSTPWSITTATSFQSFSLAGQDTSPQEVRFNSNGEKMFLLGETGDRLYEYDLGTPWDISTLLFKQSFYIGSQEGSGHGLFVSTNGRKAYIIGIATDSVHEYSL